MAGKLTVTGINDGEDIELEIKCFHNEPLLRNATENMTVHIMKTIKDNNER